MRVGSCVEGLVGTDSHERAAGNVTDRVAPAYAGERVEQVPEEQPAGSGIPAAMASAAALLVFFFATTEVVPGVGWLERGSADAGRILGGEIWRTLTALTLHVDFSHVMANAIASVLFLSAVYRALGSGLGCAQVLLAGTGGNLVNAVVQGAPHASVGASTAVFGALGLLVGLAVMRRRRSGLRGRRVWVPVAAGLAVLGMLGTGGGRVDLLAHLFGFITGGNLQIHESLD